LQYQGNNKTETFAGVLKEGYQVKMQDGSSHELKVSEIPKGTRIRVYYKSTSQAVNGQKQKVNLISRIDFLGRDEFARLREFLKVAADTTVTPIENAALPNSDPLRIKILSDDPLYREKFVKWMEGWNKGQAKKYGKLEAVADGEQADVALVVHADNESLVSKTAPVFKAFLVVEKQAGLDVIWQMSLMPTPNPLLPEGEEKPADDGKKRIEAEFEKLLKARHKEQKK
jgi:hypothetical protein